MRVTIAAINKALKEAGLNLSIGKYVAIAGNAPAMYYFYGPDYYKLYQTEILSVRHLNARSVEEWVKEAKNNLLPAYRV